MWFLPFWSTRRIDFRACPNHWQNPRLNPAIPSNPGRLSFLPLRRRVQIGHRLINRERGERRGCRDRSYRRRLRYSTTTRRRGSTPPPLGLSRFKYDLLCDSFELIFLHKCLREFDFSLIQARISERALELLNLPDDGVPRLLLDIGLISLFSFLYLFVYLFHLAFPTYSLRNEFFWFRYQPAGTLLQKKKTKAKYRAF